MTKIINLFGSAGSGKTTTSLGLAYELKKLHYKVEVVTEFVKEPVFEENYSLLKDQIFIFANQRRRQLILQNKGLDFIVTDSPLLLSTFYGKKYNNIDPILESLIFQEFNKFENINFFLNRTVPFDPIGRIGTEKESDLDSTVLLQLLDTYQIKYEPIYEVEKTESIINKLTFQGNINV